MSKGFLEKIQERDWFWAEALSLVLVLASGAALRYWLSTALPFNDSELAQLADAQIPTHGLRTPFIMINGASLFALYIFLRRSGGVSLAFAVMLLLQTNLVFQGLALRIFWPALPLLLLMLGLAIGRFRFPPRRLPPRLATACLLSAFLLAGRGVWIGLTLRGDLAEIRATTHLDPEKMFAAVQANGGDFVTPWERLKHGTSSLARPRSLKQQEALLLHAELCGDGAVAYFSQGYSPERADAMAIFDPAGAGLILAEPGDVAETVQRVVRSASPDFFSRHGESVDRAGSHTGSAAGAGDAVD